MELRCRYADTLQRQRLPRTRTFGPSIRGEASRHLPQLELGVNPVEDAR